MLVFCTRENVFSADKVPMQQQQQTGDYVEKMKGYFFFFYYALYFKSIVYNIYYRNRL
jgi:hypothetical protein